MERETHGNEPNESLSRNLRSVWTIATSPFPEAHFATFPPALAERCIRAGTSEHGCCSECGAPWVRNGKIPSSAFSDALVAAREARGLSRSALAVEIGRNENNIWDWEEGGHLPREEDWQRLRLALGIDLDRSAFVERAEYESATRQDGDKRAAASAQGVHRYAERKVRKPSSAPFVAGCTCAATVEPCTVLDPFSGAGTTALVALRLGRRAIGIELKPEYCEMARRRIVDDAPMFNSAEIVTFGAPRCIRGGDA